MGGIGVMGGTGVMGGIGVMGGTARAWRAILQKGGHCDTS